MRTKRVHQITAGGRARFKCTPFPKAFFSNRISAGDGNIIANLGR